MWAFVAFLLRWLANLIDPAMSTSSSSETLAVDALPALSGAEGVVKSGIDAAAQVDKEMNTPAMVEAGIEAHAQAARDRLQRAIAEGDIETLRKMAQP